MKEGREESPECAIKAQQGVEMEEEMGVHWEERQSLPFEKHQCGVRRREALPHLERWGCFSVHMVWGVLERLWWGGSASP